MMKGLFIKSKGFTLIELMVVMTILSVLAGIVVPAVTGTTTVGRGTAMTSDIGTVQAAVDRFVGDHPKGNIGGWPTFEGKLPDGTATLPLVWGAAFVENDGQTVRTLAPATIGTGFTTSATPVPTGALMGISYLRTALPHAGATKASVGSALTDATLPITVNASGEKPNMTITVVHVPTPASSNWVVGGAVSIYSPLGVVGDNIPVWKLDSTGKVVVALEKSEY